MEIINRIKDFFKKVKDFSLLRTLLDRKIRAFMSTIKLKEELKVFHQERMNEANELKTNSIRSISKLADEIEELKKQMDDTIKIRCP